MAHRIERINSLMRQVISELLQREMKDPRLSAMVSITEVCTSPDLKYAKVFVSHIGTEEERKETLHILSAASGFLRSELAKRLKLRRVPELSFAWDNSIERGDHILRLIDEVCSDSGAQP